MMPHTPGPWIIDNRSHYTEPAGGNQKPLQLGAVIAECPTAFGGYTIRAPYTIGKPCPTKADLDAEGLANAYICKAAPEMLRELEKLVAMCRDWIDNTGEVYPLGMDEAVASASAAISAAKGAA